MINKSDAYLSKYWDGIFLKTKKFYLCSSLMEYRNWEFLRLIDKWANSIDGIVLKTDSFEEAFGQNKTVLRFFENKCKIIMLDISFNILNSAKKNIDNLNPLLLAADLSNMPFTDSSLDLVFSTDTYGYLKDMATGLKEARRILKPGGILLISLRNRCNIISHLSKYFKKSSFPIAKDYSYLSIKQMLQEQGFYVEDHEYIVHIPLFLNCIIDFFERKKDNIKLCRVLNDRIIFLLKKYSQGKSACKRTTGWFVFLKATKRN